MSPEALAEYRRKLASDVYLGNAIEVVAEDLMCAQKRLINLRNQDERRLTPFEKARNAQERQVNYEFTDTAEIREKKKLRQRERRLAMGIKPNPDRWKFPAAVT